MPIATGMGFKRASLQSPHGLYRSEFLFMSVVSSLVVLPERGEALSGF